MNLPHPKYRADIDGLRAIAIFSVVGFHAFPDPFKGGFIGVDVFFVISGFLISTIIFDSLDRNNFTFSEFYARRIRRIFPALLLILIACFTFGWFALLADEYEQLGKHIASGAGFVANLVLWNESGYFDSAAEAKPLLHLWSLGIEEQFYILLPLLLWFAWKKRLNLLAIVIALAAISFFLNIVIVRHNIVAAYYSPLTRFWELMVGSVMAYRLAQARHLMSGLGGKLDGWLCKISHVHLLDVYGKKLRDLQANVGGMLIVVSIFFLSKDRLFPGWWALLPVLGTAMIILAGSQAWLNRTILSHRVLVWFGLISFPLYLWHWPILSFARILHSEALSIKWRAAAVLVAIILASLTYWVVEKPFRFGTHGKAKVLLLLVLMLIVGLVGYIGYKNRGFGFRVPYSDSDIQQFKWMNASASCREKYKGDDYCLVTNANAPLDAALIGDSHANHFYWGLSEYHRRKKENLINLGAGGCPPFIGIDMFGPNVSPNCYARMKPSFDLILNNPQIKTVYLAFWHDAYFDDRLAFVDKLYEIHDKNNDQYILNALIRTVTLLNSKKKAVVLLYDLPDLKMDIKQCFIKRPIQFAKPCQLDKSTFVSDFDKYQTLVIELSKRAVIKIFDTHRYLAENFPVDKKGIPMYRDYSHLSINGSLFFSNKYSH